MTKTIGGKNGFMVFEEVAGDVLNTQDQGKFGLWNGTFFMRKLT